MGVVIFCIWAASVDEKAFFAREHDEPPFTDRRTIISERRNFCSPSTGLTDHLPQNTHSYGIHYYKYGSRGVALSSMERQKGRGGGRQPSAFCRYIHDFSCIYIPYPVPP